MDDVRAELVQALSQARKVEEMKVAIPPDRLDDELVALGVANLEPLVAPRLTPGRRHNAGQVDTGLTSDRLALALVLPDNQRLGHHDDFQSDRRRASGLQCRASVPLLA